MLSPEKIDQAARVLAHAQQHRTLLDTLPSDCEPTVLDEAYAVQAAFAALLTESVGGWKVGMTNVAAQQARGMDEPVYARLFKDRVLLSPASAYGGWGRQMIEAEFAFEMDQDLPSRPAGAYSVQEVRDAVATLYPAMEICGSRFKSAGIPLMLSLADNSNHNVLVLGAPITGWRTRDYGAVEVEVSGDGHDPISGSGRNVLGDPINALHWLANKALSWGGLKRGEIIASGACAVLQIGSGPVGVKADFGPFGIVEASLSAPRAF